MTKIFSAFPGCGKSDLYRRSLLKQHGDQVVTISDSDSSLFSWKQSPDGTKERNPNFLVDYMTHIHSLMGQVDYIFVSTHKEVVAAMVEAGFDFTLVYPDRDLKDTYLERYRSRGSAPAFVKLMDEQWDNFIDDLESVDSDRIILEKGDYLSDRVGDLVELPTYEDAVFLGGTCNESTWRDELIPLIHSHYFNPVVDNWNEKCVEVENIMRERCGKVIFVITPEMTGVYSMVELTACAIKRPANTGIYFAYENDKGKFDKGQIKSLEASKQLLRQYTPNVFDTPEEMVEFINR